MSARDSAATLAARIEHGLLAAWRAILVAAATLFAFRLAFLWRHGLGPGAYPAASLARGFVMGARFDLKIAALAFLPVIPAAAAAASWRRLRPLALLLAALGFFVLDLAAIVNDGYFGFYHAPIDALVFGFIEDDTGAIWRSLWEEHPLVSGALFAVGLAVLQARLALGRARRAASGTAAWPRRALVLAALGFAVFLAIRGRLGTFPLNEQDVAVAPEPFVNALVPNGAFALFAAWQQRQSVSLGDDPLVGLRRAGFERPAEAAAALGLAPPDAPDEAVAEALWTVTRENPAAAARPPHVVLVLMESWGADLLAYHSPQNDLLGRLAPHLARGLVFDRFLSAQNGTHPTLEALLVGTPITPLTYSALGHRPFAEAAARPFQAAGYRTVFATAGSGAWRGLSRALPQQGFDEVRDQADVLAAVPGARIGTWGVYDHELFAWARGRVREADARGERLFLVLLTSTNHPPYAVPPEYRVGPLDLAPFAGRPSADLALRRPILETYQYACDALGGFLDGLDADGVAPHAIVAATGDHNTRTFFEYPGTADLPRRFGVPLFLAAPPAYRAGLPPADTARWGSHRDIVPTLAGLALSRARVFRTGEDLLLPPSRPPRALAEYRTVVADAGAIPRLDAPGFLRWEDDGVLAPCDFDACRAALEPLAREERAYGALLDWFVRRQAVPAKPGRPAGAP